MMEGGGGGEVHFCEGCLSYPVSFVQPLGCILYELCTLQPLFVARSGSEYLQKVMSGDLRLSVSTKCEIATSNFFTTTHVSQSETCVVVLYCTC